MRLEDTWPERPRLTLLFFFAPHPFIDQDQKDQQPSLRYFFHVLHAHVYSTAIPPPVVCMLTITVVFVGYPSLYVLHQMSASQACEMNRPCLFLRISMPFLCLSRGDE